MQPITFTDVLDLLAYTPQEHLQIAGTPDGRFTAEITTRPDLDHWTVPDTHDVWFGVNPVRPIDRTGRPAADDITRLAALVADLDVKPGACNDFAHARQITDAISAAVGTRPVAVTYSGHGLQPLWAVEDAPITDDNRPDMRALARCWGRLVAGIAERHHAKADSVFDLTRILRVPGGFNHKDQPPIPVVTIADTGAPITTLDVLERLAEHGITPTADDRRDPGQIIAPPAEWTWGGRTCTYARKMTAGWNQDQPTARHPWLTSQALRLAALHRSGCITDTDHTTAAQHLAQRFEELCTTGIPKRTPTFGEIQDALLWGQRSVAALTEQQLAAELGHHTHIDQPIDAPPVGRQRGPFTVFDGTSPRVLNPEPPPEAAPAAPPEPAAKSQRYSDDGNALHFVARHGQQVRYDCDRGRWLRWNGYRWQLEAPSGGAVRELVKDVARDFGGHDQAPDLDRKHSRKWLSANGVSNTLVQAATDPRVTVHTGDLDADPWILNTPGGIVNLRTGNVRPATPDDLVTRTTNIGPADPDDPIPDVWTSFLGTTFGGDTDLIAYVQRLAGIALIGQVREQILPFWYGVGANGKSTLLEALQWVLRGDDDGYAFSVPSEVLMVRKHEGHSTEIAQLAGRRLVVCSELEDGQRLAEARVKLLTGRDRLSARFLYGQPFTFEPSHTIILAGNHQPQTTVGGPALWRRLRCVPFSHVVAVQDRDADLLDKLQHAGSHILSWAIQGAVDYLAAGMREPVAVKAATAAYEADQDTVGRFVDDMVYTQGGRIAVSELRSAYDKWCSQMGATAVSAKRLTEELASRWSVRSEKGAKGARFYVGATLLSDDTEGNDQVTQGEWYR